MGDDFDEMEAIMARAEAQAVETAKKQRTTGPTSEETTGQQLQHEASNGLAEINDDDADDILDAIEAQAAAKATAATADAEAGNASGRANDVAIAAATGTTSEGQSKSSCEDGRKKHETESGSTHANVKESVGGEEEEEAKELTWSELRARAAAAEAAADAAEDD
mmetsp:Transcript_57884/g.125694  ORF Transcript_57884/g.125694 Transcript_57884/m.125694 type:complete len:165 (-) Transcript_57884:493-987(-)